MQIEFVRAALKRTDDKAFRPGMRRLLPRLEQDRASLAPAVIKAARKLRNSSRLSIWVSI